jgi:beta-phosphoglucomutase
LLKELKYHGIKTAIGSSSKNAPIILERIGLNKHFDAVADGNAIKNGKPHP